MSSNAGELESINEFVMQEKSWDAYELTIMAAKKMNRMKSFVRLG